MRFVYHEASNTWREDNDQAESFGQVMGQILAQFAEETLDCSDLDG
jgi:hypothetical protein